MSPLRRRSARLRGSSVTPSKNTPASRRLSSLTERDETPSKGAQSTLEAIGENMTAPHTPATASRIKPTFGDMHPGKSHSAASPSFDYRYAQTPATTGRIKPSFEEMHPSKAHSTASPAFDFRFARPAPQLGPEAQKMMEELREEALLIKAKLAAEKDQKEERNPEETSNTAGSRKIAMPKGKVGRFSDVHMAEFKKMDSIAGHASSFRAKPGRSTPVATPVTKSLKRTQSHAKLDNREDVESSISRTLKLVPESEPENSTPAKRARIGKVTTKPVAAMEEPATPKRLSRSQSILASLTTPTQASLARKQATQIPTLSHSPSKQTLNTPRISKSASMCNITSTKKFDISQEIVKTPSRLDRMKSLLRRPAASPGKLGSSFSNAKSPSKLNLNKELPSIPSTPTPAKMNNVNFTPRNINKNAATMDQSPSPYKSALPRSKSNANLDGTISYPSLSPVMDDPTREVTYPSLSNVGALPKPSQRPIAAVRRLPASVPGTFTFRSDKTISFGAPPGKFGSSPGQSSVRQVRPSILQVSIPGAFPTNDKENTSPGREDVLSIPHGIPNKKRHRVDSDDEIEEAVLERSPKKHKGPAGNESPNKAGFSPVKLAVEREKLAPMSRIPSPSKKGVLSLSRLNMLSRPKMRK